MPNCCEDKSCEVDALRASHGRVLWSVLAINAVMFIVEGWAGLLAHSTALLADSLEMPIRLTQEAPTGSVAVVSASGLTRPDALAGDSG